MGNFDLNSLINFDWSNLRYSLYRVNANTQEKLEFLESMSSEKDDNEIDFWNFPSSVDEEAEILVAPGMKEEFQKELKAKNFVFSVLHENIQSAIEEEKTIDDTNDKSKKRIFKDGNTYDVSIYNSWENTEAYLKKIPENYPDLASIHTIGHSHENRSLIVVKVGKKKHGKEKPGIWMDFLIHAREWITQATGLYILDNMLDSYKTNPSIQKFVDEIDWYFLPMMNPDGYVHAFTKERMWRKNRSPNGGRGCKGVDLNRNFGYKWGGSGASHSKCSNEYAGTAAFTEPEAKAVQEFVFKHADQIKVFLSYHCCAKQWRHPYSYKSGAFPEDVEELKELARNAVQNLRSVHSLSYRVGRGGKSLSGVSRDWAKGEAKIKYVYCVELASRGSGFVAPTRSIVPSGEENWAALAVIAEKIIEKYVNISSNSTELEIDEIDPTGLGNTTHTGNWSSTNHVHLNMTSTTAMLPYVINGQTESACDDLSPNCAKQFGPTRCNVDIVTRVICMKYCGLC